MSARTLEQGGPGYGRALLWVLVPTAIATVIDGALVRSWWDALSWPLVGAVIAAVVLVAVASTRRYHRIALDGDALIVGRDRLPLVELDREIVLRQRGGGAIPDAERDAAGRLAGTAVLVGGAYGAPLGAGGIRLHSESRGWVRVSAVDRERVLEALAGVIPTRTS